MEIKQYYDKEEEHNVIEVEVNECDNLNDLKIFLRLFVHDIGSDDDSYTALTVQTKNGFKLEVFGYSEKFDDGDLIINFTTSTYFREKKHLTFTQDVRTSSYDNIAEMIFDQFMLTINHFKIKKLEKVENELL